MTVLVTGAAGFIGYHVSAALLARGETVLGVDDLNAYYDVALKQARLDRLTTAPGFTFQRLDIAGRGALAAACDGAGIDRAVHLAAQAGVRYSLENPFAYVHTNLAGHLEVLELCRALPDFAHLVYASSSSVYGGNRKLPFSEADRVDSQVSLYGATKKSDELLSHAYSHLFRLPATGLRFFTVYGPWGRPDMAAYIFTRAILAGEPIPVFNHGDMKRDFTYIDDIVAGVLAALDHPPADDGAVPPHRVYNIGNHRSEPLLRFIEVLEDAIGRKAELDLKPMQAGDVKETYADIDAIRRDLGFAPTVPIEDGLPRFVAWYRDYHGA
ncbi:MAG: NAD-dependent epimerase/dehydratase family protein [Alphaproteobacteria bacterium]